MQKPMKLSQLEKRIQKTDNQKDIIQKSLESSRRSGLARTKRGQANEAQGLFLESPGNFSGPERCFVLVVFTFKIKVSMKLSVNKKKLTGLWARNCVTIQQVVILILPSGPKSFQVFRETGPWALYNQITPDPRVSQGDLFSSLHKVSLPCWKYSPRGMY